MNLVTTKQIAEILGMTPVYVRDKLVKRPDFPRPALSLSQKMRMWDQRDLEAWVNSKRKGMQQ